MLAFNLPIGAMNGLRSLWANMPYWEKPYMSLITFIYMKPSLTFSHKLFSSMNSVGIHLPGYRHILDNPEEFEVKVADINYHELGT